MSDNKKGCCIGFAGAMPFTPVYCKDRIAELEKRLEIDDDSPYDGIATRDATIKELEKITSYSLLKQNDKLKVEKAELEAEVERLREREKEADWLIINATLTMKTKGGDWMQRRKAWGDPIQQSGDTAGGSDEL